MAGPLSDSPFVRIWFHPRKAMNYVLERMQSRYVHLLMFFGMLAQVISITIVGPVWWANILTWVVAAIFLALFVLYVFGGLLKWTGGWLSGKGSFADIRAAIAWAQIPVIGFFIIEEILIVGFNGNNSSYVFATFILLLSIWSMIIGICCLAEAQKFSFFRALINYILSLLILAVCIAIIVIIVTAVTNPS